MIVTLYANTQLTPDKNFAVDNITQYLSTIGNTNKIVYTDLLYFKNKLETTIKLELGEGYLNYYNKRYNYCCIQNAGEQPVYYYIIDMEWRSKEVVLLQVYQDTISTFGLLPMTDKTLIHRQHKNRFAIEAGGTPVYAYPLIDKTSEGVSPKLYKDKEAIAKSLLPNEAIKWYLVYMNDNAIEPKEYNQVNPVSTYIVPEKGIMANFRKAEVEVKLFADYSQEAENFETPIAFIPLPEQGQEYPIYKIRLCDVGIPQPELDIKVVEDEFSGLRKVYWLVLWDFVKSADRWDYRIEYRESVYNKATGSLQYTNILQVWTPSNISEYFANIVLLYAPTQLHLSSTPDESQPELNPLKWERNFFTIQTSNYNLVSGINAVDFTDSRLIKIIELPYAPITCNMLYGEGYFDFDLGIKLVINALASYMIKLDEAQNLYNKYINSVACYDADFTPFTRKYTLASDFNKLDLKAASKEPKLYNSESFSYKLVYDSFVHEVFYENIDTDKYKDASVYLKFKFVPSKNIASKFLFDFKETYPQQDTQDYDNILIVARNNEMPIYSNQYINYLRTGYNYDIKAKEQREKVTALGAGLSTIGAITSAALGVASGNPAVMVSSIVGAGTAVTSSIVSSVSNSISATRDLEEKQAQLRAQATSVATSDDLCLLDYYTKDNKLKVCTYKPSQVMQNNLFNLYHYLGYKCEYMEKPNVNSRLRFNFLQASIDIDFTKASTALKNITKPLIDDYKARFEVGVTIFHYFDSTYDFEQKYENYETILENYLQ